MFAEFWKKHIWSLIIATVLILLAGALWVSKFPSDKDRERTRSTESTSSTSNKREPTEVAVLAEDDSITPDEFYDVMGREHLTVEEIDVPAGILEGYTATNRYSKNNYYTFYYYRLEDKAGATQYFNSQYHEALRSGYAINSKTYENDALSYDDELINKYTAIDLFISKGATLTGDAVLQNIFLKRKGDAVIKVYSYAENLGSLEIIDLEYEINKILNRL